MALPLREGSARLLAIGCAAALTAASNARAGADGALRATASLGYDSNPSRDFSSNGVPPAWAASVQADGQAQVSNAWAAVTGEYTLGGRAFANLGSEDTLVQSARVQAGAFPESWLQLGLEGLGKDRRGGERSYTDAAARAFATLMPTPEVEGTLRAGARRFQYWPAFQYSYASPTFGASVKLRIDRHHSVTLFEDAEERTYNSQADPAPLRGVRQDRVFTLGATYQYRGPWTLSVTYFYSGDRSNSAGQTLFRHRVTADAAVRLPWRLVLLAEGALQLVQYPEGIALDPSIQLLEDNENTNSLSLRLVRPLSRSWDVELNYAIYYSRLPSNSLTYLRQLATVGVAFQL